MNDFTEQLARLSPKKRALFELLLKQQQGQETIRPRQSERASYPLSFSQQRLWFLDQFEPGSAAYNIAFSLPLAGPIDSAVLERCIHEVVRLHEVLRTTFRIIDGQPAQVIAAEPDVRLVEIDLRGVDADEEEAWRIATAESARPFDLAHGPLLRATLLRLKQQQQLLLTIHHIVCDGWSIGILIDDLKHIYTAYSNHQPSPLRPLTIQYADYALWQRQRLQGETLEKYLAYWTRQLGGMLPVLDLPSDRPRPPVQTYAGATLTQILPANQAEALRSLSRSARATLFMTMLAAAKTLLYTYTGQPDILIGVPILGRNYQETERLIGFFVNTVVVRTSLAGNPTFLELLERVRVVSQEAYAHQDMPFEMVVEKLHPQRDTSRNPLFQVMFSLETNTDLSMRMSGASNGTSKFDLSLDIMDNRDQLVAYWEYNTDLFDATTIKRMQAHFSVLLSSLVADPGQRIGWLPILTEAERRQILTDWNAGQVAYPQQSCIHDLFEAQAARTPDRIAVSSPAAAAGLPARRLTYDELNVQANRLAHYLGRCGVRPGACVGVCVERSPSMIVAVLGILKAGAAYIPLDAEYPEARLDYMIRDAGISILLTQEHLRGALPAGDLLVVCLDRLEDALAVEPDTAPPIRVPAESVAYIIYTSGSTGQPKGVIISHRSLANAYTAWEHAYRLRTDVAAHLQMASFSFDVFAGDLVRALCSGGKLALCPREFLLDSEQLYAYMRLEGVDCAEFVPAVARQLVQYLAQTGQSLDWMRLLAVGSDSWLSHEFRLIRSVCGPATRLINSYGVSEATIDSSYFECRDDDTVADERSVIGRHFPNTRLYVLNRHAQPLPASVPGELHIGGPGLAYGYLNQPARTAEYFIPDPFAVEPGSRLYKTGDLVCLLPDGTIQFLGRIDQEVKLRGFRIHIAEIESAIGQHPAIRQNAVLAREDGAVGKQLVAYICFRPGQDMPPEALGRFLKQRLPGYMIPGAFVSLDTFPLTPNGKIDRAALPAPTRAHTATTMIAPRTPVEQTIAGIWRGLLGIAEIGIDDNFFDLGGHSLLASQLAFQLREAFQVPFQLRSLFMDPTIAGLAQIIEGLQHGEARPDGADAAPVDFQAEAVLDPTIPIAAPSGSCPAAPAAVLLTGATGFVGAFLLAALLRQTGARVYVLVRAADSEQGRERIWRNLEDYGLDLAHAEDRIIPVCGDLARPWLGLSEADFDRLAEQVEIVYHCATWVNFTYPYAMLKPINVLGTQEIVRFAGHGRAKPVHFVSTLSVFPAGSGAAEPIEEVAPPDQPVGLVNGYAESKWVAEKLLWAAAARGLPVAIYRPALIGGDSRSGQGNQRDLIWHLIKGCVQMGSAPRMALSIDLAPVDYVSRAIVHLSLQAGAAGKAFHLFNPRQLVWNQLVAELQHFGYQLRHIPYDQWRVELDQAAAAMPDHALHPFLSLFPEQTGPAVERDDPAGFDARNTLAGLAGTTITCPALDSGLVAIYLSRLIANGFLEAPDSVLS